MNERLYLLTLEIVALDVGQAYSPLPSHLTLVSRFWSPLAPDVLARALAPVFQHVAPIDLIFQETIALGPKRVMAHIVQNTPVLQALHQSLIDTLTEHRARFAYPEFIGDSHKPHVSARLDDQIIPEQVQTTHAAYLIEVTRRGDNDLRHIRHKFDLAASRA